MKHNQHNIKNSDVCKCLLFIIVVLLVSNC